MEQNPLRPTADRDRERMRRLDVLMSSVRFPCKLWSCFLPCVWSTAWISLSHTHTHRWTAENRLSDGSTEKHCFLFTSWILSFIFQKQNMWKETTIWAKSCWDGSDCIILSPLCALYSMMLFWWALTGYKLKAAQRRQKHVWCTSCSKNLQSLKPALLFALAEPAHWALQLLPPHPHYWIIEIQNTHTQNEQ